MAVNANGYRLPTTATAGLEMVLRSKGNKTVAKRTGVAGWLMPAHSLIDGVRRLLLLHWSSSRLSVAIRTFFPGTVPPATSAFVGQTHVRFEGSPGSVGHAAAPLTVTVKLTNVFGTTRISGLVIFSPQSQHQHRANICLLCLPGISVCGDRISR